MTVAAEKNRMSPYSTDGIVEEFDYDFETFESSDMLVYYTPDGGSTRQLVLNTDYTVDINEDLGGTIETTGAPLADGKLLIVRHLDIVQETDYIGNDPFPAETAENSLDRLTMICLQLQEQIDRGLFLPISSDTTGLELPEPEANKILGWNSAGDGIENRTFASLSYSGGLTDLNDVTVTGAVANQVLHYSGGAWRNVDFLNVLGIGTYRDTGLMLTVTGESTVGGADMKEVCRYKLDTTQPPTYGFGMSNSYWIKDDQDTYNKICEFRFAGQSVAQYAAGVFSIYNNCGVSIFRDVLVVNGHQVGLHDYDNVKTMWFNVINLGAADRTLTIDMGQQNQSFDWSAAAGAATVHVEAETYLEQDYRTTASVQFDKMLVGNGSVSAPSFAFNSYNDTGLYVTSAVSHDTINMAIDGVKEFSFRQGEFGVRDYTFGNMTTVIIHGANSADRTLTIDVNDGSRVIEIMGSCTLNDWFDQEVKITSSPTFSKVIVESYIEHSGDADTFISFGTDTINIIVGGVTFVSILESIGPIDNLTINPSGVDVDFIVETMSNPTALKVDAALDQIFIDVPLKLKERSGPNAATAGYGQLWVNNATPCELWFTDDTGTSTQIV